MKKLIILLPILVLGATVFPDGIVYLEWKAPPVNKSDVDSFVIHYSYDANVALTNWPVATNFPAVVSNNWVTNIAVKIPSSGKCFFYITSSNYWGDGVYSGQVSNITNTPPLPENSDSLQIVRR